MLDLLPLHFSSLLFLPPSSPLSVSLTSPFFPFVCALLTLRRLAGYRSPSRHECVSFPLFRSFPLFGSFVQSSPDPRYADFGSEKLKKEIIPDVLAGKKFISLAITEAFAGSDVAGLRTTATKTADGKHFVVNGTKKWITNGNFSDYFSTAVNTGNGLSMLLIPRGEGVDTKLIKTTYSTTAGTAFITFDNVKVPVENLLGKEGKGLFVVLSNFKFVVSLFVRVFDATDGSTFTATSAGLCAAAPLLDRVSPSRRSVDPSFSRPPPSLSSPLPPSAPHFRHTLSPTAAPI